MKIKKSITYLLLLFPLLILCSSTVHADNFALILTGSGGQEEYQVKFNNWSVRLKTLLQHRLGFDEENIRWLAERSLVGDASHELNLSALRETFACLQEQVKPDDTVFVFMIGHGSHLRGVSKFHIPDEDLTSQQLNALLSSLTCRQLALVNSASSSAGFINILSGSGRALCTSTRSVEEKNATEFMEGFVRGLEDGSADKNRDDRISLLEACSQAAALTQQLYKDKGLILTEHALLDDNGDQRGTALPFEVTRSATEEVDPNTEGVTADKIFLKDYSFPENASQETIDRYLSLLGRVEQLKMRKSQLSEEEYYKQLEVLLIDAARVHREIRAASDTLPSVTAVQEATEVQEATMVVDE